MGLSSIVDVIISVSSAAITRAGFGTPLILSPETPGDFTERVRYYTSMTGVAVDFATTTSTYKIAARIFGQTPHPPRIAVGRLALKPTQSWTVTPTAVSSTVYSGTVDGVAWTFTSDGSATLTEVCTGIAAAIDAASSGLTCTNASNTHVTVVATVAGAFHSLSIDALTNMAIIQDHADPGLATDLAAIALEDNSWYAPLFGFGSYACIEAIADWVESAGKVYVAQTQDSAVATLALSGDTTTIAAEIMENGRTSLVYHPETDAFADAGLDGRVLPLDPGSETWAFKTLTGVSPVSLTETQLTNLRAKNVIPYVRIAGVNVTLDGKVGLGEYLDVVRFRDWLAQRIAEDVFVALSKDSKLPFTDAGISVVVGVILARLKNGVAVGGLSPDPAPICTAPKAADVSDADKAARTLTGVTFAATLAGAVHAVTIHGTLSV